jgi:hypothetical protein
MSVYPLPSHNSGNGRYGNGKGERRFNNDSQNAYHESRNGVIAGYSFRAAQRRGSAARAAKRSASAATACSAAMPPLFIFQRAHTW